MSKIESGRKPGARTGSAPARRALAKALGQLTRRGRGSSSQAPAAHAPATPARQPGPTQRLRARRGEAGGSFFRSDRMFTIGHHWYSSTREGVDMGPYTDRREAEVAIALFVARQVETTRAPGGATRFAPEPGSAFEEMVAEFEQFLELRRERTPAGATVWVHRRIQELELRRDRNHTAPARIAALEYLLEQSEIHL